MPQGAEGEWICKFASRESSRWSLESSISVTTQPPVRPSPTLPWRKESICVHKHVSEEECSLRKGTVPQMSLKLSLKTEKWALVAKSRQEAYHK